MRHTWVMVQEILLWLGSGFVAYLIWAYLERGDDAFPFRTRKDSHLIFLLIFLAAGWLGLVYIFLGLARGSRD